MKIRNHFFVKKAPAEYVNEGLIYRLDGIENAGNGVHDDNILQWANLAGGQGSATLKGDCRWMKDHLKIIGARGNFGLVDIGVTNITSEFTVEICCDVYDADQWGRIIGDNDNAPQRFSLNILGDGDGMYEQSGGLIISHYTNKDYKFPGNFSYRDSTIGAYFKNNRLSVIHNGQLFGGETAMGSGSPPKLSLGNRNANGYNRGVNINVYSFRVYNRALTPDEIRHNHEVDNVRYLSKQHVGNYCMDGLVLWFDAEWNDKEGRHKSDSPFVSNIAPLTLKKVCNSIKAVGHYTLHDNGIGVCRDMNGNGYPDGGLMWQNAYGGMSATERTLEICMSDLKPNVGGTNSILNGWSAFPNVIFNPAYQKRLTIRMSGFETDLILDMNPGNPYFNNPLQYAIRTGIGYRSTVETDVNSHGVRSSNIVNDIAPGMSSSNFTNENVPLFRWDNNYSNCIFHSLRMYTRKLTDEEVANNYAIDKARFGL